MSIVFLTIPHTGVVLIERNVDEVTLLAGAIVQLLRVDLRGWLVDEWSRWKSVPPYCGDAGLLLHCEDLVQLRRIVQRHKSAYWDLNQGLGAVEAEEV